MTNTEIEQVEEIRVRYLKQRKSFAAAVGEYDVERLYAVVRDKRFLLELADRLKEAEFRLESIEK